MMWEIQKRTSTEMGKTVEEAKMLRIIKVLRIKLETQIPQ